MPTYGAVTAQYQGTVNLTLNLLPYTLPVQSGVIPGLAWIADEPIATSGVYFSNTGTAVDGLQTWLLTPTGYTTIDIGAAVTTSNINAAWSGGNWAQWNGVTTLTSATNFLAGNTGYSFIGSYTAGTYAAQSMTATSIPSWSGVGQCSYPIKWQGVSYMLQALEFGATGAGNAVLGHADGTTSIATVWPGADTSQTQRTPACYPDTGGGFNYFMQDGLAGDGVPSIVTVSSTNAAAASYNKITLSNSGHNALFAAAFVTLPYVGPLGWGFLVTGGLILLSPDGTKYWFYTFTGGSSGASTIIGNPATWTAFTFFDVGVFIAANGTVYFSRSDTGSPTQPLISVSGGSTGEAVVADLWFSNTAAFVDLTVMANRRKFIAYDGGAQQLGSDGSSPFGTQPPVFLTSNGTPSSFGTNAGRGGPFGITGGTLTAGGSAPNASAQTVVTANPGSGGEGVLGDYASGNLYAFNVKTLTDNGTARRWLRRWRALANATSEADRFAALQIAMQTGIDVPEGTQPHVMLRWSDDGGSTWSDQRIQPVGPNGKTAQVVKFNRLGSTRRYSQSDRIFELTAADQFPVVILWAQIDGK